MWQHSKSNVTVLIMTSQIMKTADRSIDYGQLYEETGKSATET